MDACIEIEALQFGYRGRPTLFKNFELCMHRGEMVGLIGPNGAGKTTLLELVQGKLKPSAGSIRVLGVDASARSVVERAQIAACLPQKHQSPGAATVYDIIMSGRRPYRSFQGYDASDERVALDAAERLNVSDWLDRKGSDLSGGEYQRVLLARVLAQDTPILLCDEPASSLDPKYVWSTFKLLKDLAHNDGVAVLVSIHDLALAATMCDRLVLIKNGEICFDGLASNLDDKTLSFAYETSVCSVRTISGTFFSYG